VAQRALKPGRIAFLLAIVALGFVSSVWLRRGRSSAASGRNVPAELRAPEGVRIRVQVVNSTTTRGLARRATMLLRDRGFDVVESGTGAEQLDSTLVLDRSGHPDWANRVAAALGGARVHARPDSTRYLDVTVLLGRSWRPPTEPFYP
jgi:hypothetical protein